MTGLYHVMVRGVNQQQIFSDEADCTYFQHILFDTKKKSDFRLYAYCLMNNHYHMLIEENNESLESIFKRIGVAHVSFYNWKYQRVGHLYQDRFRSEAIESNAYFLDVYRYICQNPVKAGLSKTPLEYRWLGAAGLKDDFGLLDDIKRYTSLNEDDLLKFIGENCTADHIEDLDGKRITDDEAEKRICAVCGCSQAGMIEAWPEIRRNEAIVKGITSGLSIRQFSRLTGISKGTIEGVIRRKK